MFYFRRFYIWVHIDGNFFNFGSSNDENNTEDTESGDDNGPTQERLTPKTNYPGVNSLKKIKVSPPKEGKSRLFDNVK